MGGLTTPTFDWPVSAPLLCWYLNNFDGEFKGVVSNSEANTSANRFWFDAILLALLLEWFGFVGDENNVELWITDERLLLPWPRRGEVGRISELSCGERQELTNLSL